MPTPASANPSASLPPELPRPCPLCGAPPGPPIFHQKFAAPAEGGLLAGYGVHTCAVCGLGFASPLPSQAEFDAYYARLSKYEYSGTPSPLEQARHRWTAGFLKAQRGTGGRVLDLGCATGWLMEALIEAGFTHVEGLEPSPFATAQAQRKGLAVTTGTLWTLDPAQGPWDLVILGSVLEHIRDLPQALERLVHLVPEGGQLHLEVPDASRYVESTDAPFQEFSLEHINYFGPISLRSLLTAHGFQCLRMERTKEVLRPGLMALEIKALFQRGKSSSPALQRDEAVANSLAEYVAASAASEAELSKRLHQIAESQAPILVWGVGTHTQHLLASTPLGQCNILAFIDKNPRYHGLRIAGRSILAPEAVVEHPVPVLIGSYQFQEEIERMLRESLGLSNPVIELYPRTPSPQEHEP